MRGPLVLLRNIFLRNFLAGLVFRLQRSVVFGLFLLRRLLGRILAFIRPVFWQDQDPVVFRRLRRRVVRLHFILHVASKAPFSLFPCRLAPLRPITAVGTLPVSLACQPVRLAPRVVRAAAQEGRAATQAERHGVGAGRQRRRGHVPAGAG
ncbi:hypothetical protein DFJ74DRAFT_663384 [Hyaloraphidium curvatum]|nr:hypothetical protein DFJ74DRAFT_663384 [Hyaloraphidium curvatum]